mmetsp:Transcript_28359/g.76828  ORF Transcript_28359/g.76828 Transcript_28359/m.76828 type:complete len:238 (+) Transcript_28359:1002-1715(+)
MAAAVPLLLYPRWYSSASFSLLRASATRAARSRHRVCSAAPRVFPRSPPAAITAARKTIRNRRDGSRGPIIVPAAVPRANADRGVHSPPLRRYVPASPRANAPQSRNETLLVLHHLPLQTSFHHNPSEAESNRCRASAQRSVRSALHPSAFLARAGRTAEVQAASRSTAMREARSRTFPRTPVRSRASANSRTASVRRNRAAARRPGLAPAIAIAPAPAICDDVPNTPADSDREDTA